MYYKRFRIVRSSYESSSSLRSRGGQGFPPSKRRASPRGSQPSVAHATWSVRAGLRARRGCRSQRDIETRSLPNLLVATLATLPSMSLIPSAPFTYVLLRFLHFNGGQSCIISCL